MVNFKNTMDWMERNEFVAVSVKEDDADPYFSRSGCETDPECLGSSVYECVALDNQGRTFKVELCHEALSHIFNGED